MCPRDWLLVVLASLVVGATVACSDGAADATPTVAPTTPPPGRGAVDRPPPASAASGGQSVTLGIGTYCWGGICLDAAGPVTGTQALSVTRGAQVVVANPATTLDLREAVVYALPASGTPVATANGQLWNFPPAGDARLAAAASGGAITFAADLPAGRYVVIVGLYYVQGDVQYGLLLDMR